MQYISIFFCPYVHYLNDFDALARRYGIIINIPKKENKFKIKIFEHSARCAKHLFYDERILNEDGSLDKSILYIYIRTRLPVPTFDLYTFHL